MTDTAYDTDFYTWTQAQAALLRQGRAEQLDWENLAEEIESLGNRDKRELKSRLEVLIMHLLKWWRQPEHQSRSWQGTIREQRDQLADLLEDSPSLRRRVPDYLKRAYPRARRKALDETGLYDPAFPPDCPWTVEQVLDPDFFPEPPP